MSTSLPLHPELGSYSHVRTGEGLFFVSGQVPLTPDGQLSGPNADTQARQVVKNLVAALATVGLTPSNVIKITAYVTSSEVAQSLAAARAEHFTPPYPASTVTLVPALLSPDWLLEVEAIAGRSNG